MPNDRDDRGAFLAVLSIELFCVQPAAASERRESTPTRAGYARERSGSTPVNRVAHERNTSAKC